MNKIKYTGKSKLIKGVADKINYILDHLISDVKVNGTSVVSDNIASITVPVNVSDLNNDVGFITKAVNDLENYYLTSETYTKTEVNDLISSITTIHFEVESTFPQNPEQNIIYLIPAQTTEPQNFYEEWIWFVPEVTSESPHWELIGTTEVDLSNYIQKSQTSGLVKNDGTIDTTQYAPMSDIPTVNNATLTIQKNGVNVQTFTANASSNKTANITVPITQADLTEVKLTNEDLNDVTYPGFYYAAGGNTVTNKPTGFNNFGLVVIHNASGSQYVQIISNENGSYRRIKKADGTWTSWAEDKFTDTIPNNATLDIQLNGTSVDSFTANASSNVTANIKAAVNNELTNEDLDTVKVPGFYVGKSGNTCSNKPSGVNQFGLYVIKLATSNNNYWKQTLVQPATVANGGSKTYSRSQYNGTWTSWIEEKYTDTTYSAGAGISISSNEISNSGVRSIATGTTFGSLSVNEGGTSSDKTIYMNAPQQSAGQDLNNYKTSGIYYFSSTTPAHQNTPFGIANGVLIVIKSDWSARAMVKQIFMRHGTNNSNENQIYTRSFGIASNAWSYWHEVVTSKPTSTSSDNDVLFEMNGRNGKAADEQAGTSAVLGETYVNVGNSTAYPNNMNSRGNVRIYGANTRFIRLTVKDDMTTSYRSVLPSVTCNLAPNYIWSLYSSSIHLNKTNFVRISTDKSVLALLINYISITPSSVGGSSYPAKYIPILGSDEIPLIEFGFYDSDGKKTINVGISVRNSNSYYEAHIVYAHRDGVSIIDTTNFDLNLEIYEQKLEPVT